VVAPFPVTFKPFVIAQGVSQVPFVTFVIGTLLERGSLFFFEGILGVRFRYGALASVALAVVLVLVFFLVRRLPELRRKPYSQTD
jgi:hypothetical protein